MKKKYILVSLLMVALVMGGTGYSVSAGSGDKVTGGGTFEQGFPTPYADSGDKISFGFNAQGEGDDAKGHFHLVNHNTGMKVSATISKIISSTAFFMTVEGTCLINGEETKFEAKLEDRGEGGGGGAYSWDILTIWLDGEKAFSGLLFKGNIQVHKVKT